MLVVVLVVLTFAFFAVDVGGGLGGLFEHLLFAVFLAWLAVTSWRTFAGRFAGSPRLIT